MAWEHPAGKFVDISFDYLGSTLYAWGNQDLFGVLCAYEFGEHGVGEEIFRGKYKVQQLEHHLVTRLYVSSSTDRGTECI